jgi:hypothetical protein
MEPDGFRRRYGTACWLILFALIALPAMAEEDVSIQPWLSFVLGRQQSDHLYMEVEIQPKGQISGGEQWRNIDVTWMMQTYPNPWISPTFELVTGLTKQTETENSYELTPKFGLRFHLITQVAKRTIYTNKRWVQWLPHGRFYFASWLRLENRNFFYSGDQADSHEWRFRIRPEFKVAINNPSLGDDKTFFGRGDIEFFIPLSDDIPERFTNKIRLRLGPGYRFNHRSKIELLCMFDENRESSLEGLNADAFMLDLRLTLFF